VQPNGILAGAPGVLPRVLDVVRTAFVEDPAEVPART
jgi:hypothetical protein